MAIISRRTISLWLLLASPAAAFCPVGYPVVTTPTKTPTLRRTHWSVSSLPPLSETTETKIPNENAIADGTDLTNKSIVSSSDEADNVLQQFVHRFLAAGGGEIGERGEPYFLSQAAVIVIIALGGIPGLASLMGSTLLAVGVVTMAWTALDMGESLTPWPKPNGGGLVQDGLYGQVRHPMYAGLLASVIGFSLVTGSVDRLAWTGILYVAVEIKSEHEEQELAKAYPEYKDYRENVQTKFVPKGLQQLWKRNRSAQE